MNAVEAAAMFMPMVTALMREAEKTGASGPDKQEAVAAAAALQYKALQGSVKELRGVPWELVAPLVVNVETGVITVLASMFNTLLGKVWSFFSKSEPAPA